MPTAAEVIVQTLADSGIKRVYGLPGDSLNGVTENLQPAPAHGYPRLGSGEWVWRVSRIRMALRKRTAP